MPGKVKDQWHPAFYSAMELNFRKETAVLFFETEHNLNRKPLEVDMLIIRKDGDGILQDEIGKLFAEHNLIEYKSPDDALNIDTLYKVLGYGCLYKALSPTVNGIPSSQITLTIIRHRYPRSLFQALREEEIECRCQYPGIYYLTGRIQFRTQVIVTRELRGQNHLWLRSLCSDLTKEEAKQFLTESVRLRKETAPDSADWKNADAVADVAFSQNADVFELVKKEDTAMCDALRELMKPEIEEELTKSEARGRMEGHAEGRAEGRAEGLSEGKVEALYGLGWDSEKISDQLNMPEDEVEKLIQIIQRQKKA